MPDDGSTRVPHLRLVVNNGPVTRRPRGETIALEVERAPRRRSEAGAHWRALLVQLRGPASHSYVHGMDCDELRLAIADDLNDEGWAVDMIRDRAWRFGHPGQWFSITTALARLAERAAARRAIEEGGAA